MRKLLLGLIGLLFSVPAMATVVSDFSSGLIKREQGADTSITYKNLSSTTDSITVTASGGAPYIGKVFPVTVGQDYTISWDALTTNGTGTTVVRVVQLDEAPQTITQYGSGAFTNGDTITAEKPYVGIWIAYPNVVNNSVTISATGLKMETLDPCRNLFDSTPYKTGYYINESGVEQSANVEQYIIRQAVVQPGTKYTLSFVVTQAGYTQRYHAYDANGNWLSQVAAVGGSEVVGTKVIKTFTTPANTKYIRQGGRSQSEYQLELGSTATAYVPFCATNIKIATTAYNSARFSPVVNDLNSTIATIRSVVTNTINQTKAIADLQATKQTRPDENCPAGKKCLLVETEENGIVVPHWYEIIENAD